MQVTFGGKIQAIEAREEIKHDILLAETHGKFALADYLAEDLAEIAVYLDACRSCGISDEFPGGEFAVYGMNFEYDRMADHYAEDEGGW